MPEPSSPQPSAPAHAPRTASVLVVDDEPGMRNFIGKALASRFALVETADSVETAEALRQRYRFDLLIVDIRLPGESGVEWVARLRENDVTYICDIEYDLVFLVSSDQLQKALTKNMSAGDEDDDEGEQMGRMLVSGMGLLALKLKYGDFDAGHSVPEKKRITLKRWESGWRLQADK